MNNDIVKVKIRLDILSAVERYNTKVPAEKQIIMSQEMVLFEEGKDGEVYLTLLYVQQKDIGGGTPAVQNVSIPV
jgi:hypothetical protein